MSTLSLRKIKHDSASVDNITLDSTGNIGVAASALSNSRIFLGGGNNQTALLFSNNSNGVVPPDVFGGAIDMNHSAGSCEVGFWNAYTANTLRSFAFYQRTGATTKNELMRIDTAGRVTMPYQPAFRATNNNTSQSLTANTEAVVQYNAAETNIGNHYNTSTYRFTAPISGFYHFSASILVTKGASTRIDIIFRKNATAWVSAEAQALNTTNTNTYVANSMQGYLNSGDYVDVVTRINDNGSIYQEPKFWNFSGFLVS